MNQIIQAAITEERSRIAAIFAACPENAGGFKLATDWALRSSIPVENVRQMLAELVHIQGGGNSDFAIVMGSLGNPALGHMQGEDDDSDQATINRIVALSERLEPGSTKLSREKTMKPFSQAEQSEIERIMSIGQPTGKAETPKPKPLTELIGVENSKLTADELATINRILALL
jgi:hypothetical protein